MHRATGPVKSSAMTATDVPCAARRASVFLMTLYSTPPSRNFLRSFVTVSTSTLENSATMADLVRANFSWSSLIISSFSLFSTLTHLLTGPPRQGGRDAWAKAAEREAPPRGSTPHLQSRQG